MGLTQKQLQRYYAQALRDLPSPLAYDFPDYEFRRGDRDGNIVKLKFVKISKMVLLTRFPDGMVAHIDEVDIDVWQFSHAETYNAYTGESKIL